jgi:putative membrane protein
MSRFPSNVYGHGNEPDVRFTFANERTFLAWARTALALIAGGVALEAFGLQLQAQLRSAASLLLIGVGVGIAVYAWFGWAKAERALRRGIPLPTPSMSVVLSGTVATAGVLVMLAVALR